MSGDGDRPEDAEEDIGVLGREGEAKLKAWLDASGFSFIYIRQDQDNFATLFRDEVKRPDFLVLINSIGFIAVDAKYYTPGNRGHQPAFGLKVATELRLSLGFERLFRIPVWYAFRSRTEVEDVWYWISALKADAVGESATNNRTQEQLAWVRTSHCVRVATREDFAKLFTETLTDLSNSASRGTR